MNDNDIWWQTSPTWLARGVVDTILRLLEQEEITRSRARELIRDAMCDRGGEHDSSQDCRKLNQDRCPAMPWDKLNWA